jgi:hypothetical protein
MHGAQLQDLEPGAAETSTRLPKQGGTGRFQLDQEGRQQEQRREQHQEQGGGGYIQAALAQVDRNRRERALQSWREKFGIRSPVHQMTL